jgi:hypothetical protein
MWRRILAVTDAEQVAVDHADRRTAHGCGDGKQCGLVGACAANAGPAASTW